MKKILSLGLSMAMVLSMVVTPVLAANDISLTMDDQSATAGETVTIPVNIELENGSEVNCLEFDVDSEFDVSVALGTDTADWGALTQTVSGTYRTSAITQDNPQGKIDTNGEVLVLTVVLPETTTAGKYTVSLTEIWASSGYPASEIGVADITATITVEEPIVYNSTLVVEATSADGQDDDSVGIDSTIYEVVAGDKVTVSIYAVECPDFTNAKWTLTYDTDKFAYVSTNMSTSYYNYKVDETAGVITDGVLSTLAANAYSAEEVLATYTFKALAQTQTVTADFDLSATYLNDVKDTLGDTIAVDDYDDQVKILMQEGLTVDAIDKTVDYSGSAQSIDAATASLTGALVEYSTNNTDWSTTIPTETNVGEYTIYVRATLAGYITATDTATLTIEALDTITALAYADTATLLEKEFTVTVTEFIDASYTGYVTLKIGDDTYTLANAEVTYNADKSVTAVFTESVTGAGYQDVTATYVPGTLDNYNGSYTTESVLFVGSADLDPTIVSSFVYDGTDHSVTSTDYDDWTYEVSGTNSKTNVGEEYVTITYTNTAGIYENVVIPKVLFEVTPAEATVTVDTVEIEYGTKYVPSSTTTGVVTGETLDLVYDTTDVESYLGTYDVTVTGVVGSTVNSNYSITYYPGAVTVKATEGVSYYIEVVTHDEALSDSDDYVKTPDIFDGEGNVVTAGKGYRMIIFYTNKEGLYANYAGLAMYDVSNATYIYVDDDGKEYTNTEDWSKYAIVVPAEYVNDIQLTSVEYRAQVEITNDETDIGGEVTYGTDVNDTGKLDENDLSAVYAVYNGVALYMTDHDLIVLGADIDYNKIVNTADSDAVINALKGN